MVRLIVFLISLVALCSNLRAQDSVYFRANNFAEQIERYYAADRQQMPEKGTILFVGSSSIAMWKNLPTYFPTHSVLPRGFGGAWISDVLYHINGLVLKYKPGQIVLYAGENDISNGVAPQRVFEDVKCFLRLVEINLPGVPVLVLSVKPSPYSQKRIDKQRETNALLKEYCDAKKGVTFVDIFSDMVDKDGNPRPELYLGDHLHINTDAYQMWAKRIEPLLINNK